MNEDVTVNSKQLTSIIESVARDNLRNQNQALKICPFVLGPPGCGKTAIVTSTLAKVYGDEHSKNMILQQHDIPDISGLGFISKDDHGRDITTKFRPSWISDSPMAINLDELPQAMTMHHNLASEMLNDNRIGDFRFHPGSTFAATGNRQSDRAATNMLPSHLLDRMTIIHYQPDQSDVRDYFSSKPDFSVALLAYSHARPENFGRFDPDRDANPTYRSFERASTIINMDGLDLMSKRAMLCGQLGNEVATEFLAFEEIASKVPLPEEILKDPMGWKMPDPSNPDRSMILFHLAISLAHIYEDKVAEKYNKFLSRLCDDGSAEYALASYFHARSKHSTYETHKSTRDLLVNKFSKYLLE